MLTRRAIMLASIAAGVAMQNRTALAMASQPSTPVNFDVPAGACDCHTHIHADPAKFPFFSGRVYTPELASPEEMTALHKALHIERVVIVTPSVYGTDNSATLFGMKARGCAARLHAEQRGGVVGAVDARRDDHHALDVQRLVQGRHFLRRRQFRGIDAA